MKSIRTNPTGDAGRGDERIRTAVCAPSTDAAYASRAAHETLRKALELRHEAYRATPVRDDTRDAHFALEELRILLVQALRAERRDA